MSLVPRVVDLVRANGQDNVLIFAGGIIPEKDVEELKADGIYEVYGPGTSTTQLVEEISKALEAKIVEN